MRLMGLLFACLTFLAGITVGTAEIALINIIAFLGIALVAEHFLAPRFGRNGLVYGMAGAFFLSVLWPAAIYAFLGDRGCIGADCPAPQPQVTVTMSNIP